MNVQAQYQQKRMSANDAIRVVKNGDTIVVPTAVGEPPTLLTALSEARRDFRDVQISQILPVRKYAYFDQETQANVRHTAYFFSGASRPCGPGPSGPWRRASGAAARKSCARSRSARVTKRCPC